ncbi:hypothetical protein RRF57_008215 [Xylaria bambusicola]|uniref:Uncharacterized protein n=1 Tax=Xylaria bambusicola TaxID=326684 RepID=A0AAN7UUX7_9PEZI
MVEAVHAIDLKSVRAAACVFGLIIFQWKQVTSASRLLGAVRSMLGLLKSDSPFCWFVSSPVSPTRHAVQA